VACAQVFIVLAGPAGYYVYTQSSKKQSLDTTIYDQQPQQAVQMQPQLQMKMPGTVDTL
jgi:hypothetical protein